VERLARELARILYVEDEADIRTIAELALCSLGGFEVRFCADGREALAALPGFAPDLVLLDVMMPGIDGIATLAAMRADPAGREVPVVFMTARTQPADLAHYRSLGALDVITKPFDPMELPDRVRAIWARSDGSA
jgi:DNA-binding response OmpR family regulator